MRRTTERRRPFASFTSLPAMLACCAYLLLGASATAGQTAADIVENPVLLSPPNTDNWDYQSRYFIENVYKSIEEKNYPNARRLVDRVMEIHPFDVRTMQIAIFIAFRQEDWAEAERLLSKWLAIQPDATAALVRRAVVRSRLGHFRQSLADFEEVMGRNPSPALKKYVEETSAKVDEQWRESRGRMEREWGAIHPDLFALQGEKRWADVEAMAGEFIKAWPESAEAHYVLGLSHLEQGRVPDAEVELLAAEELAADPALKAAIADMLAGLAGGPIPKPAPRETEAPIDAIAAVPAPPTEPDTPPVPPGRDETVAQPDTPTPAPEPESEWDAMTRKETELRERRDWDGLEKLYGELILKPDFVVYASVSRAYLRYTLGRYEDAKADFSAYLNLGSDEQELKAARDMIALIDGELAKRAEAEAWAAVQEREKALRDGRDWPELEALYDRLVAENRYAAYALQARAYLRYSQGRAEAARDDFAALLKTDADELGRASAEEMIVKIDAELRAAAARKTVDGEAEELSRAGDWEAVERLYDAKVAENPDDPHALAMRGFARLDLGRVEDAEADFEAALANDPDEPTRNRIEETGERFRRSRAEGVPIGSPRAEELLGKIGQAVSDKKFDAAAADLAALERIRLNADQAARRDFFTGEVLWSEERFEEAYPHYTAAAAVLSKGYYLSEALWKIAEYHLKREDRKSAVYYIQQSAAAMPEAEWRHVQAGYAYSGMSMDHEAVHSFEKARALETLREDEADFYDNLGRGYLNLGDRDLFHGYTRRQIDIDTERVNRDPTEKAVLDLYGLRRDYANQAKRIGGHQFVFADRYERQDYMVQYQNEINFQFRVTRDIRAEAYFQTVATIASRFSGTYFDTWSGIDRPYAGQSNLKDGINVVAGARVYPFARLSGLSLAFDQVFKIGRETENDTRFHVGFYDAIGNDWNPVRCSWNYASLWADAIHSFERDDFTFRSEGRVGRSFRYDTLGDKVVVTPYLGLVTGYGGRRMPKSERMFLEGGPGIMFRKYFDEDKYYAPRQSLDLIVQFRFGLTHNRSNALSVMLFHSF